jgi:DNA-binding NarL/FixJ family response regulator
MMIETQDDLVVVGEAANGDDAVALALALCPDVVPMDIRMPGTDGIRATRRITGAHDPDGNAGPPCW